jgi:cytosine/adenosine deaminase-related metal-dependent hydrolase
MRTAIKAGWIVGHENGTHTLIRNGVLIYEGNRIIHVGDTFEGRVDETLDATDKLLAPGSSTRTFIRAIAPRTG